MICDPATAMSWVAAVDTAAVGWHDVNVVPADPLTALQLDAMD